MRSPAAVLVSVLLAAAPTAAAAEDAAAAGKEEKSREEHVDDLERQMRVEQLTRHIERTAAMKLKAPELPAGKEWFNSRPLSFERELEGKIVLLDFWTYCCINCIHVLPDLAYLEEKYAGHPVAFIGVHSAKFANEKVSENIRQAVLRYDIGHPVVNDDEMALWQEIGVSSWPSIALVDPRGNLLLVVAGEGHRELLDAAIAVVLARYPASDFRHEPLPLVPERLRPSSPLRFPGKLAVDAEGKRLFISDSNHHRIIVCDLEGRFLDAIGSGRVGLEDGPFERARFHRLQGLAYDRGLLYVADAENHALRRVDLAKREVTTLAGDGIQGRDYEGGGRGAKQRLSTPWDVAVHKGTIFIAMAGTHQIWEHDIESGATSAFSGSGAEQNFNSDDRKLAAWAQPSGLSIGGGELFIADSESSSIRAIDLASGATRTIAGGDDSQPRNLFAFGDVDGTGDAARLQHPLGVLWLESSGRVLVADTYNHRLKLVDPRSRSVVSWVGSGKPGFADGSGADAAFFEPSGFALAPGGKSVYVADTNNHAIRIVELETGAVRTLELAGVPPPAEARAPRGSRLADMPGTPVIRLAAVRLSPGAAGKVILRASLPEGTKYIADGESRWQILAEPALPLVFAEAEASGVLESGKDAVAPFRVPAPPEAVPAGGLLRVEALAYYCKENAACSIGAVLFEVPIEIAAGAAPSAEIVLDHTFGSLAESLKNRLLIDTGAK